MADDELPADKPAHDDPAEIERAKERMAGPLGREIVKFPLQFAQPALISCISKQNREVRQYNGTATLVRIQGREYAITCEHVIARLREEREKDDQETHFQIGELGLDPIARLTGIDEKCDLAVIDIAGLRHRNVSVRHGDFLFHEPVQWPPAPAGKNELVSFAGFPGAWRQPPVGNHVDFDTFAIGAQPVTSSYSDRLAFQFERGYWVSSYGVRGRAFSELGGLSGGPVMVMRQLHWEMAGFITHFSKEWDILFATPSARVRADGRLDTE